PSHTAAERRLDIAEDQFQERRFARAVFSEHGPVFVGVHLPVDAAQNFFPAQKDIGVFDANEKTLLAGSRRGDKAGTRLFFGLRIRLLTSAATLLLRTAIPSPLSERGEGQGEG